MARVTVPDELADKAKRIAGVEQRSLSEQIAYWARLGKIGEENDDLPFSMIKNILRTRDEKPTGEYVVD